MADGRGCGCQASCSHTSAGGYGPVLGVEIKVRLMVEVVDARPAADTQAQIIYNNNTYDATVQTA